MFLGEMIRASIELFQTPFSIFGYTFSWWSVWLFGVIASLLLYFVFRLFK